jgi:hypothetical protein
MVALEVIPQAAIATVNWAGGPPLHSRLTPRRRASDRMFTQHPKLDIQRPGIAIRPFTPALFP